MSGLLTLLQLLLPQIGGNSAMIGKMIEALVALLPVLAQGYKDLLPIAKSVIATLRGDPATTAEQLAALDALDLKYDAAFDAAAEAALAEDAAADQ